MPARAVYNSRVLAIYITGPELTDLLLTGLSEADCWIGKVPIKAGSVSVQLDPHATGIFRLAYSGEEQARIQVKRVMDQIKASQHKPRVKGKPGHGKDTQPAP